MNSKALKRLEQLLTRAADQAIQEGFTIIAGTYNPNETSCDPMFALCREDKAAARRSLDSHIPLNEEIVTKHIKHRFSYDDLKSYLLGFDTDYPFSYPIFVQQYYVLDEDIFNMARRLRQKYITKQPSSNWSDRLQQLTNKAKSWVSNYAGL